MKILFILLFCLSFYSCQVSKSSYKNFDSFCIMARPFSEGLAFVVHKNSLTGKLTRGYINKEGIFEIIFDEDVLCGSFHGGYAWILCRTSEGIRYGFINRDGKLVIKPQFYAKVLRSKWNDTGIIYIYDFDGDVAWVRGSNYKYALINREGLLLTDYQYDEVSNFTYGLARVKITTSDGIEKYGCINKNGKLVLDTIYDYISNNTNGSHILIKQNGLYGYSDRNGTLIVPPKYISALSFSEGLACVNFSNRLEYIDEFGRTVYTLPAECKDGREFKEGMAAVLVGNKWGYIDKAGNFIIPAQFNYAGDFHDGVAIVEIGNKELLIDKSGNFLTKTTSEEYIYIGFSEGVSPIGLKCSSGFWKFGYISAHGEIIIPLEFDSGSFFKQGIALVKKNSKFGYINIKGEYIVSPIFDDAIPFENGFALVKINKYFGFLKGDGSLLQLQIPTDIHQTNLTNGQVPLATTDL